MSQEPYRLGLIMAVIHCLGTGLVGAWVAKRLALLGHEVHAYDIQPHRVMDFEGITAHQGRHIGKSDVYKQKWTGRYGSEYVTRRYRTHGNYKSC